jgi:hypothetical protein
MTTTNVAASDLYRIWITKFVRWQPHSWRDLPQEAIATELAEPGCFSAADALAYVEGHNTAALGRRDRRWAVAVPIVLAYEGDPRPGDVIFPQQIALAPRDD